MVASDRAKWGNSSEFLVTALGFAVGLGNIWRFPSLAFKHGGGVFFIPYILCLFSFGIPLCLLEFTLGQFSSLGPTKVWQILPMWKGLGLAGAFTSFILSTWYNAPISYGIYFFFMSFTNVLPWKCCAEPWAAKGCLNGLNMSCPVSNITDATPTRPSEDYFYNKVLHISDGLDDFSGYRWELMLCNLFAWAVVFLICIKGAKTLGKVAYFTSLFPYVVLTVFLIFSATLEGAGDGMYYYVYPDFSKLGDVEMWKDAAVQVFFSVGPGGGGLIALSSFNQFQNNHLRDAMLVPILDGLTSIYSGFAVFGTLGFMAHAKNVTIENVVASGPGLIFVTYPEALALMTPDWVGVFMSILFFFMIILLGISSKVVTLETLGTIITDERPSWQKGFWKPALVRAFIAFLFWLVGLIYFSDSGFYLVQLLDSVVVGWGVTVLSLFEVFLVSYIYGIGRLWSDLEIMRGPQTVAKWIFLPAWMFLSPVVIIIIFVMDLIGQKHLEVEIYTGIYRYPDWYHAIAVPLVVVPLLAIPGYLLYYMCTKSPDEYFMDRFRKGNTPALEWGPAEELGWVGRYKHLRDLHKTLDGGDNSAMEMTEAVDTKFDLATKYDVDTKHEVETKVVQFGEDDDTRAAKVSDGKVTLYFAADKYNVSDLPKVTDTSF